MDKARLLLTLISIVATIGPISCGLIIYRDDLIGLVIPFEAADILNEFSEERPNATLVETNYDVSLRKAFIKINLSNPYRFAMIVNSVSADVECNADSFHLGHALSEESKIIPAGTIGSITLNVIWTPEAVNHVQSFHSGSSGIIVDLTKLMVDVQGIAVELPSRITLPEPIPFT